MSNRIGGDYSADALEAFRSAYAAQMQTPEDLDIAPNGLPGNEISNTSPWLAHTGLWKANDGLSRDFVPNQPFNPDAYLTQEDESGAEEEELTEEEFDSYLDSLSLDELHSLAGELGIEVGETATDDTMSEEEVENLIAELNND
jgi:hypothetical protein